MSLRWVSQSGWGCDGIAVPPSLREITARDEPARAMRLESALSGTEPPASLAHVGQYWGTQFPWLRCSLPPWAQILQHQLLDCCRILVCVWKRCARARDLLLERRSVPRGDHRRSCGDPSRQQSHHAHSPWPLCSSPYCPPCQGFPETATPLQPTAKHGRAAGWQCWDAHCTAQSCTQGPARPLHAGLRTPRCTRDKMHTGLRAPRCA